MTPSSDRSDLETFQMARSAFRHALLISAQLARLSVDKLSETERARAHAALVKEMDDQVDAIVYRMALLDERGVLDRLETVLRQAPGGRAR